MSREGLQSDLKEIHFLWIHSFNEKIVFLLWNFDIAAHFEWECSIVAIYMWTINVEIFQNQLLICISPSPTESKATKSFFQLFNHIKRKLYNSFFTERLELLNINVQRQRPKVMFQWKVCVRFRICLLLLFTSL